MAISFSRPDPSSPAAVADANFPTARRGFDQHDVREFLRMVAAELARAQERERYLEQELRSRRQPTRPTMPAQLDEETAARLLGEETTRILQAARESAAAMRSKAEDTAERVMREAREEAQRMREDAELEASRRRRDAEVDAEAELEMAKQQGREMVEEARTYRERALAELARRRDLARQQIDQLVHGRDRLVQAFERARLVAADVVAELAPLGELDEYVNLSPTTGPVPVMVPASKLAEASSISDETLALQARSTPETATPAEPPATIAEQAPPPERVEAEAPEAPEPPEPSRPSEPGRAEGRGATVLQFPMPAPVAPEADDASDRDESASDDGDDSDDPAGAADAAGAADSDGADGEHTGTADEIDDDDVTASDVDDLFARLRSQRGRATPTAEPASPAPTPFEHRDEVLTPLIVASARKLKRVLADEQNAALDRLRRREAVVLSDLVGDEAAHVGTYVEAIASDARVAAEAGADAASGAPGSSDAHLEALREAVLIDLVAPLRERLQERIAESGGDNDAIGRAARAVYREWKTKHIDDHVEDFVRLAFNRGALASVIPGSPLRWMADPAIGACSECEDNTLQGAVPAGTPFPTGHVTAPAHPGCRCLLVAADR